MLEEKEAGTKRDFPSLGKQALWQWSHTAIWYFAPLLFLAKSACLLCIATCRLVVFILSTLWRFFTPTRTEHLSSWEFLHPLTGWCLCPLPQGICSCHVFPLARRTFQGAVSWGWKGGERGAKGGKWGGGGDDDAKDEKEEK